MEIRKLADLSTTELKFVFKHNDHIAKDVNLRMRMAVISKSFAALRMLPKQTITVEDKKRYFNGASSIFRELGTPQEEVSNHLLPLADAIVKYDGSTTLHAIKEMDEEISKIDYKLFLAHQKAMEECEDEEKQIHYFVEHLAPELGEDYYVDETYTLYKLTKAR